MPRMIELIRQSGVPASIVRSAAKGALALPPAEMLEILVYLASHPVFGDQARMTLAGWDEGSCLAACSDPAAPRAILDYFITPANRRPRLLPALLDNPSLPEIELLHLAHEQSAEIIGLLLASTRAMTSLNVLQALASNPALVQVQQAKVQQALSNLGVSQPTTDPDDAALDAELKRFLAEHAAEIAAEYGKAFCLTEDTEESGEPAPPAFAPAPTRAAAAAAPLPKQEPERTSPLQKISRLTVGERVQLAMKGNREERFILVRDGVKVVSSAVLESPKLSDQEIETFASMKNVQESVLRGIAGKRKFIKQYAVVRALVNNPRCPLDVQLTLVKNLLAGDLRAVSMNKNISDTIRKVAAKMFREKTERRKGVGE